MLKPGDKLERYEIKSLLGQGGMGQVYLASDPRLQRDVALKVLLAPEDAGQGETGQAASRMLREARTAAALNHPNAISVFDVGEWQGGMYIAMELIQGKSLRKAIGDASIPVATRIRWLADAARALAAAHRAGIIHRDIKPDNIMVRDDGVVKVLDFGIARRTAVGSGQPDANAAALSTMTGAGVIVGTPLYMAPEQIRGEELDPRADQFSWGVTAWELLVGELPWGGDREPMKLLAAILTTDPGLVSVRAAGVPPEAAEVVARTMKKAREDRFSSMDEVAQALDPQDSARVSSEGKPSDLAYAPTAAAALPAQTNQPVPSSTRKPGSLTLVVGMVGLAALGLGIFAWSTRSSAPRTDSSARASASVAPATAPVSSNAQAASAYERGERSFRNASSRVAYIDFDQARKLDPSLAAALFRMALIEFQDAPSDARTHMQRALQLRDQLHGADRALLEAAEAWMVRDDPADAKRKLEQGAQQYPADGLIRSYLAARQASGGDLRGALKTIDEAVAIEPTLATAWMRKGRLHLLLGELPAASSAYDQCLKIASTATDCLEERMGVRSRAGQCQEALRDAQAVVNADPTSDSGYYLKASLLAGMDRPRETVFEVLKQRWDRIEDAADRKQMELTDRISYEELQGKFQESLRLVAAWKESIAKAPDLADHAAPAMSLCELNLEIGKADAAAKAAADFLQKMDAYSPVQRNQDVSLIFLESLLRGGKLTRKEFEARRGSWFKNEQHLWLHGYAMAARTAEEAREALAALRSPADMLPTTTRSMAADLAVGRVYTLAGKPAEALAYLKAVAGTCDVLADPIAHTQANLYLGMALADTGDREGACKAWQVVIRRWGEPASQSVTAAEARKRAKAADCE